MAERESGELTPEGMAWLRAACGRAAWEMVNPEDVAVILALDACLTEAADRIIRGPRQYEGPL